MKQNSMKQNIGKVFPKALTTLPIIFYPLF